MPTYDKFLKEIISKMQKLEDHEAITLTTESNMIVQNKLPQKLKDPRRF